MELLKSDSVKITPIPMEFLIEGTFFIVFIPFIFLAASHNYILFHSSIELFCSIMLLAIFIFAYSTYNIGRNNFLMLISIGYFFVALIDILHIFTYEGVSIIYINGSSGISTGLCIAARYIGISTCLLSLRFIFKPVKKINVFLVYIIYLFITAFLVITVLYINTFLKSFITERQLIEFKSLNQYFIAFIYILIAGMYYSLRKRLDFHLFVFLEMFLLISSLSELLLARCFASMTWAISWSHIFKAVASFSLYKGMVKIGINTPFDRISNNLNLADSRIKEFEEVLFKNDQAYDLVINNSDNAIVILNEEKLLFSNGRALKMLGAKGAEEIINLSISKVLPKNTTYEYHNSIYNTLKKKDLSIYKELQLMTLDGRIIEVEMAGCYCTYHGKPAIIGMFRDISTRNELKRLEQDAAESKKIIDETREMNKTLTEFFSNISHELKTPLNVLLGAIQILALPMQEETCCSDNIKTNKYLKIMKQNCYRLLRIVNNLIDLSKFDSGYMKLNLKNHNIVSVVEEITLSVADYIEEKGIELIFDTDSEERMMAVDADKIERIILNLLSNAVKFTDTGGQILVNFFDGDEKVIISVKDTGIGIPKDKLDIIFERFGQVDKTLSRNYEGSGIGLSLVKSIIDMHEGTINVFSKEGEGSEFVIQLPVKLMSEMPDLDNHLYENKVEKIKIEFSDIYS